MKATSELYTNIRKRREELGLSQEEVAKLAGYRDRSSITKIESGLVDLPQSKIIALAQALKTTPAKLLGWEALQVAQDWHNIPGAMPPPKYKKIVPKLGRISAGIPIYANENIEGYAGVDDERIDYALIVQGDSMTPLVREGGEVYVVQNTDYSNGDIVIALINGEDATVKRFYRYGDEIILRPENTAHDEQVYKAREVSLQGKVVEIRHRV
ncbi:MAG: helix-turn-helix domain-containing protein [Synergistaceae bacterium]|nr:helix-turn-helix domain-containing protein [Synergistaceae bacterium]